MIITPPDEINLCHACPSGTFQEDENSTATSCTACGFFQFSLAGSDSCSYLNSTCPAGFQSSTGMQKTHDRECGACPSGMFKATSGNTNCAAHATPSCPAGEEARGTSTADATCQACPAGTFKATVGTEKCAAHKAPCDAIEQTETTSPSATEDRVCANKYVYAEATTCCSEWQDANGDCQFYKTECGPGFALQDDGGIANDKTCQACPAVIHEITSGAQDDSVGEADCAAVQTHDFQSNTPAGCFKESVSGNRMYNTGTSTTACSTTYPCIQATFMFKAGTNADACTGHRTTCPEATELNKNGNSTKDHACDPCQAGDFKAGTNADQCATCASGTWTSDNIQCVAHTVCDATTEVQLAAGTTSSDTVCGCAADHHSDGSACQACGAGETRLAGDSKLTASACCSGGYQTAATEVCTSYSEDAASCNALRKPFVDGDASTDASCGPACNSTTEYASGASCVAYTTTCPAGQQLSTTLTPAADLQCSACPQGTYKEASGGEACAVCAQGNEIFPLDATEGGTGCGPCDKTQEFDADGSHTACVATEAHCDKGFYFHETAVEQPNTCTPCASGTYQPLDDTTNACVAWTVCLGTEIEAISPTSSRDRVCACAADHHLGLPAHASVTQIDFASNGASDYVVNGQNDPDISVCKDKTIVFERTDGGHALRIVTAADCAGKGCDTGTYSSLPTSSLSEFANGDIAGSSKLNVTLSEGTYYYVCNAHSSMVGKITVGSCDGSCQACGAGETRLAGDAKDEAATTCCANSYQLTAKGACQAATDCAATSEQVKTVLTASSDRVCECAENYRYDGSGACQACTGSDTRLAGDAKVGASKACCSAGFQASAGGSCTAWHTTCNDNHELTGGTASAQKTCVACASTKQSTGGAACTTFAERHYSSSKPTSKAGIETALSNSRANYRTTSVKNTRMDFRSMIKFMKTEIAALTGRRVKLEKSKMVLTSKFSASLGSRTEVEVVVPKSKTKLDQADACTEKDIDLSSQTQAYDVSLEEGEVSLICTGSTPMTKLRFEQDSNLHTGVTDDTYKYSCWTGSAWDTEVSVTVGDDYQCGANTYYVNSHSGVTCTATAPVSSLDSSVVAGTNNCGTVGEGHACTDFACNANFVLQSSPVCNATGYTPAVCHCPENFYEDGTGQCIPHSTCSVGEGKTADGTATTDTQCAPCSGTTFSSVDDKSACQEHSTCPVGQGKTADGTASADTQCATCTGTTFSASDDKTACQQHATCPVGKGKTADGTASADTQCADCTGTTFSAADDKSACQQHATCPIGKGKTADGTASTDTQCADCTGTTFSASDDKTACQEHSTCPVGEGKTADGTASADTQCATCTGTTFSVADDKSACQEHATCPVGKGKTVDGTASADTQCADCTGTTFSDADDKSACQEHSTCPVGQGKTQDGTASADTVCAACVVGSTFSAVDDKSACQSCTSSCNTGEVVSSSCSASQNLVCVVGQCTSMPDSSSIANADGQGTCTGTLTHSQTCQLSCDAGHHPALYTCDTETLNAPSTACMACEAHEHSDGDSQCASDTAYSTCQCTSAACTEAVALDKYLVAGNSDSDDSQCLDVTIKQASDCPDGSEFTSANTGTADGVCTPCGADEFSSAGSACQAHSTCPVGEGKTADGTNAADTQCAPCTGTTFSSVDDKSACQEHSTCPVGKGKTQDGTASADTQCADCTGTTFSSTDDKTACQEHSTCPVGQGKTVDGTASADTQCATCTETTFSPADDKSACQEHSTCPAGKGKTQDGTASADTQCSDCTGTTFSAVDDKSVCQEHSTCPAGKGKTVDGTASADTQCADCTGTTFSASDDKTACQEHSTCPAGEGKTADGTASADTQCATCTGTTFSAADDKGACQEHSTCPVGKGKTADGTASADTQCADCTGTTFSAADDKTACQEHATCPVGEGKTVDGTASTDTQCAACTGTTFSAADDKSACQDHSTCPAGEGQTVGGTDKADTQCAACATGTYSSADDNTACQACVTCSAGENEITACTSSQNRVCAAGQCSTMPDFNTVANADGQGTCTGTLLHSQTCKLSCDAGHHPALYTCNTNTLNAPTTSCMVCEAYEHSDGDSHCATDAAYTACQCTSAACTEAVAIDKYFVVGNSDTDDSQCLDATIKEASDCPDGSEFTSDNTGTANGVCTSCGANEFSSAGASCQAHSTCPVGEGKTADGTNAADTQCASCTGTTFSAVDDKSACQEHSTCPVGKGKTQEGTASADTQCGDCTGTTFSSSDDKSACQEHATCPVGKGKIADGTASADTQCADCTGTTFSAVDDKSACQEHSTCPVGKGKTADGTASADIQCADCTGTTFSSADDKSACQEHSTCSVGKGKTADGTASADTQCEDCAGTTFSAVDDKSACQAHATCPVGEGKTVDGTASTDIQCAACGAGFYSTTDDRTACQSHSPCAAGKGVLTAGTSNTDTTCEDCVGGTSFSESSSATETCQACAGTCLEEEAIACTASQNRVCGTLQACTMPAHTSKSNTDSAGDCLAQLASSTSCSFSCTGGYSAAAYSCYNGTLTEPAEACLACQLYEHSDGDAATCATDAAYTTCGCNSAACPEATGSQKYFVAGNSNADDSQCLDLTISQASDCADGSEFTPPTGTSNGVCTPCAAGSFSTGGAACQGHATQCPNTLTEFISQAGSLVSNIQCSALLVCGATQLETAAPSTNAAGAFVTNRQCGCLATEEISGDKCLCKANHFVSEGACTSCEAGYSRAAGDEKTGGDTACSESPCTSFPAQASVAFTTAVGSCSGSLAHGASCSYTCAAGFQAQSYTCDKGVLTAPEIACLCPAQQHESAGACVDDTAYTNCGCSTTACTEMSNNNKFFSIGMQDNLDSSECRLPSFTEEKLGTAARPTTETAIAAVIDNFKPSYIDAASNSAASAATKKEQFKSVITYSRREIAKLPQRRVAIDKASMVVSQEFLDSVPAGKKVDIVIPKPKTPATLANLAIACTEKDIQLSGQDNAYDVALEEGDTSLICHGTTAKTKLKRDANGYKYSCVDGNAWTAEISISEDSSYTCPEGGKYFVNSHSGTTCAVEPPVSQSFPSITAGTSGTDCGTHIGENATCSYECNSNFLKVSGPACSSAGVFTRAVCSCVHDGFVDNAMGSCQGCTSGTFSTGGQACQPWTVTEASCNTQNKVFVAGTHSTDSSCGITCAGGLIADGALCKEPSTAVSCASLEWMYFSDTCCDGVDRAISCMASLTEQKIKIVDSLATLKQDSGADCTDGMEVSFKAGKIVCK